MNWNQLQYVITIAEEKSITRAARKLFISQPSLSLSIQALEKETGVTLFTRNHGEISLTYAGTLFYEWAVSTLHSQQQLALKLNDISENARHLIRFGISPHRSSIMLPTILDEFYKTCSNCELQIVEKPTFILKELLENDQIDFIIDVANPNTVNYQNDLLAEEKIMLAVPASLANSEVFKTHDNSALSAIPKSPDDFRVSCDCTALYGTKKEQESLSLSEMTSVPFIMLSADHIIGTMSRKICESAAFHPDVRLTCINLETALNLAAKQIGATFVPEIFAKQQRFYPDIQYYNIRHFHGKRQICLVYRKNLYQHTQIHILMDLFRKIVPQLYMI